MNYLLSPHVRFSIARINSSTKMTQVFALFVLIGLKLRRMNTPGNVGPVASHADDPRHRSGEARKVIISRVLDAIIALLGTFALVTSYLDWLIPGRAKPWVLSGLVIVAILIAEGGVCARFSYRLLKRASPLLVAVIFCVTTLTFVGLRTKGPQTIIVKFDPAKGGLYSAWDDPYLQVEANRKIKIFGTDPSSLLSREWVISDENTAHFTFEADSNLSDKHSAASSGGYMTFYETPCDLRKYRELRFSAKVVSDPQDCTKPDFGVRLEWDPPNGAATFEIPSLLAYPKHGADPSGEWQSYSIDTDALTPRAIPSSPETGLNRYTVNKVAFFVAKQNISKCRKATLWFRDVRLDPTRPQ